MRSLLECTPLELDWERITILKKIASLADSEFLSHIESEAREYYRKLAETYNNFKNKKTI